MNQLFENILNICLRKIGLLQQIFHSTFRTWIRMYFSGTFFVQIERVEFFITSNFKEFEIFLWKKRRFDCAEIRARVFRLPVDCSKQLSYTGVHWFLVKCKIIFLLNTVRKILCIIWRIYIGSIGLSQIKNLIRIKTFYFFIV